MTILAIYAAGLLISCIGLGAVARCDVGCEKSGLVFAAILWPLTLAVAIAVGLPVAIGWWAMGIVRKARGREMAATERETP